MGDLPSMSGAGAATPNPHAQAGGRRGPDRAPRSRALTAFAASMLFLISLVMTGVRPWGVIFWAGTGILATWIWMAAWEERAKRWWRRVAAAVILFGWGCGTVFVLAPSGAAGQHDARLRAACAGRLRHLGRAMQHYAHAHGGRYPDRPEELLSVAGVDAAMLVCPAAAGDAPATGPSTRDVADSIASGGHLSYVYLGKGRTAPCAADVVLAYDRIANHRDGDAGVNVLMGDGTVTWVGADAARGLVERVRAEAK